MYIAREYIEMYSDIGQKSNTMIFSEKPGDLNALMAQASAVVNAGTTSIVNNKNLSLEDKKSIATDPLQPKLGP